MKTYEFINKWKTGRLGKKRQHAGYRVLDGDHCQVLVQTGTKRGVPTGSKLIGVYFPTPVGQGVCLFHENVHRLRSGVMGDVWDPKPIVNRKVLNEDDEHILESGIIEFGGDSLLLEIGTTPWLLYHDKEFTTEDDWRYRHQQWRWDYNTATQIPKRVSSIEEAESAAALPPDEIEAIGYRFRKMPVSFVPETTSEEEIKVLSNPPTPFEYGFGVEDLILNSCYGGHSVGLVPVYLRQTSAATAASKPFRDAVQKYNDAAKRLGRRTLREWERLRKDEEGSIMQGLNEQIYVNGKIHNVRNGESYRFHNWAMVLGESSCVRLPA